MKVIKGLGIYLSASEYNRFVAQNVDGKTLYFLPKIKKYAAITNDVIQQAIELLSSGKTVTDVCKELNVSRYKISKALSDKFNNKNIREIRKSLLKSANN